MPFGSNSRPNSEVGGGMGRREQLLVSLGDFLKERKSQDVDHHRAEKGRGIMPLHYCQSNKLLGRLREK